VDVLVNNAGITLEKKSVEVTDEEWDRVLATNLTGIFRCARAVAPGMIERGRGKIINVGSMYGRLGVPRYAAYCATKAAIDGLTRSLAAEWARHGIQVNAIAQNFVENPTYFGADIVTDPQKLARVVRNVPAGRLARAEESARLAVYLASADADFFCGQVVPFAGGWA
jgi:2-deoxy-D-gluconate 3-dehydrogenase